MPPERRDFQEAVLIVTLWVIVLAALAAILSAVAHPELFGGS